MAVRSVSLSVLLAITALRAIEAMPNNTTRNESLTVLDVKQDFDTVINGTESAIFEMLLFRYPAFLKLVANILNDTSDASAGKTSSLSEYGICKLVEENLKKTKDACELNHSSRDVKLRCNNSPKVSMNSNSSKPSFYDICQQFRPSTTQSPTQLPNMSTRGRKVRYIQISDISTSKRPELDDWAQPKSNKTGKEMFKTDFRGTCN